MAREFLGADAVDVVEGVALEAIRETGHADQAPLAAQRHEERRRAAPGRSESAGASSEPGPLVAQLGRKLLQRELFGLGVEAHEPARGGELERALLGLGPEHAPLRLRLEAEPLDDAFGERLERDAGEQPERALEQAALAHELDVLRQQPRVLALEAPLLEDALEAERERAPIEGLEQVVARARASWRRRRSSRRPRP